MGVRKINWQEIRLLPPMIVLPREKGWKIIFQRNHALLATKLALKMKESLRPEPWPELLVAIAEHDDGQASWDSNRLLTSEGTPCDFQTQGFDKEQAEKVIENATYKSSIIALLTSLHTSAIYQSNSEAQHFLKTQRQLQQDLYSSLKIPEDSAKKIYAFMKWCDECSLLLCREETKVNEATLIGPLSDDISRYILQRKKYFTISPWCFEEDSFSLSGEYHMVEQMTFSSNRELSKKIDALHSQTQSWDFRRTEEED